MIDLTEEIIELPIEEFEERIQRMPRTELVSMARKLEAENERLKRELSTHDMGSEALKRKLGYRGYIVGKLRLCGDRLAELKREVVTVGVFFKLDEDGLPTFYMRAARMQPAQYVEALLDLYGSKAPPMINSYKVDPESVPTELWDDFDTSGQSV